MVQSDKGRHTFLTSLRQFAAGEAEESFGELYHFYANTIGKEELDRLIRQAVMLTEKEQLTPELAKELYNLGFFEPSRAEAALACLDMMEFEGKNLLAEKINEKNAFASNYSEMFTKLLELALIVEKEHPELIGMHNTLASKFAANDGKQAVLPTFRRTKKTTSKTDSARARAARSATPR